MKFLAAVECRSGLEIRLQSVCKLAYCLVVYPSFSGRWFAHLTRLAVLSKSDWQVETLIKPKSGQSRFVIEDSGIESDEIHVVSSAQILQI